jgi:hypothetical protein
MLGISDMPGYAINAMECVSRCFNPEKIACRIVVIKGGLTSGKSFKRDLGEVSAYLVERGEVSAYLVERGEIRKKGKYGIERSKNRVKIIEREE